MTKPDLSGQHFGRLEVIGRAPHPRWGNTWLCICECGKPAVVFRKNLTSGITKSCGCLQRDTARKRARGILFQLQLTHPPRLVRKTHGAWVQMKQRCMNPRCHAYERYGGSGITVCQEWISSFSAFFAYIGLPPTLNHSLDRWPNKAGGYEPGNVRWATRREQQWNIRSNVWVESPNGDRMPASEAARIVGVAMSTITDRHRKGWTGERLFSKPSI